MGRKSRAKRERRQGAEFVASLTACEGTWLERPPDAGEQRRIEAALKALREQRKLSIAFHQDPTAANVFSIELFRGEEFAPLQLEDWLVDNMIDSRGEPPVPATGEEQIFSDYLREAVLSIASPQVRRALAGQLNRFLPGYVEAGKWKEAIAIDYNAFRTSLGNEVSPFLAQMALAGLARYYEAEAED